MEGDGLAGHLLGIEDGDSPKMKIEVRHLTKVSNKDVRILNKVNLDIPKGVIMGVMGPSGSGKSTFLRALNRLWEPDSATVFLDGVDICELDVLSLHRKVGMLFQLPVLFEGTVADNIRYGPNLRGCKLNDEEVHKLLALADLDSSFYSKSGGELSVGQAQRVTLARTLANEPEVLLLDEPTSALDPISTENIENVLLYSLDEGEVHLLGIEEDGHSPEMKIEVRHLTKISNKDVRILNNVNLDIPKGVIMGVIGPSGSGKSTFLRALNRLWEPDSATVFFDGVDICELDVLSLRRKVGMLFQLPVLFEGTVADNVRYGPNLRGYKLNDNEVYKLLALADLDSSFCSKSGGELSVGQAQRVALARTLANEPEVLLLDEPTSALDPISTENIENALLRLKKEQEMTIIIVSHSIKQIQRICDVVCLLVDGEIVEILESDLISEAKHPMAQRFLQLNS